MKVLKSLAAVAMVALLIIMGLSLLAGLLAIAAIVGVVLWVKKQNFFGSQDVQTTSMNNSSIYNDERTTIIEGRAEEVTLSGAQQL